MRNAGISERSVCGEPGRKADASQRSVRSTPREHPVRPKLPLEPSATTAWAEPMPAASSRVEAVASDLLQLTRAGRCGDSLLPTRCAAVNKELNVIGATSVHRAQRRAQSVQSIVWSGIRGTAPAGATRRWESDGSAQARFRYGPSPRIDSAKAPLQDDIAAALAGKWDEQMSIRLLRPGAATDRRPIDVNTSL